MKSSQRHMEGERVCDESRGRRARVVDICWGVRVRVRVHGCSPPCLPVLRCG